MKDLNGFWLRVNYLDGFAKIGNKLYKQFGRAQSMAEKLLLNELVDSVNIIKIDEEGRETIISTVLRG